MAGERGYRHGDRSPAPRPDDAPPTVDRPAGCDTAWCGTPPASGRKVAGTVEVRATWPGETAPRTVRFCGWGCVSAAAVAAEVVSLR